MEKEAVEKLVNIVIAKHCEIDDKKHSEILKEIKLLSDKVNPVVQAFNNYSTTGKIASKVVFKTAQFVIALGVIIGSIYTVKEWIKK
ncbi:MAG: hypothetical protein WC451_05010 [Patescibacteria group bacterium]|jgi:hypothetical protein